MTIQITINISLEAADIATLLQQFTASLVAPSITALANNHTTLPTPAPQLTATPGVPFIAAAELVEAEPVAAQPVEPKPAAVAKPPKRQAVLSAPAAPPAKKTMTPRLPFDELDSLTRREIKRLSMDGRIPNAKLWDSERDPRLPTMGAILIRYKARSIVELADPFGMEPPLSATRFVVHPNGAPAAPVEAEPVAAA